MSDVVPPIGAIGLGRWAWRQFTSMRTALVLLFLLALASIPGSVLPQRGTNPIGVRDWIEEHGAVGTALDAVGMFDVYAAPWFAAVYLLLFTSLVGCVIPRLGQLWRSWRKPPPPAPRRMSRLAGTVSRSVDQRPEEVLEEVRAVLAGGRWRVREGADESGVWLSAEKGYLKDAGNLFFHIALLFILVGVGIGGVFGWRGSVIVREGQGFSNTITQYDDWSGGRFVTPTDLPPFSFTLDSFDVEFERQGAQRGEPRSFDAQVTYRTAPDAAAKQASVQVNQPLDVGAAKVYLVGHGYAPGFVVTDAAGATVFDDAVVFLPQDGVFNSTGVIKIPDTDPPLGFDGLFLPTVGTAADGSATSTFPGADDPGVVLVGWRGDLGLDSGVPQSVYSLQTEGMERIGVAALRPGQSWTMPGGGTVTFTGWQRWASFQIANNPGQGWALLAALLAMLGLSISVIVQRRRLWVKAGAEVGRDDGPGQAGRPASRTVVEVGGLMRTSSLDEAPVGALVDDIDQVVAILTKEHA